jgi:uncharacterized repeat protein (TIGR01451 family)
MRTGRHLRWGVVFLLAAAGHAAAQATSYDLSADFSLASNPSGAWSYGYSVGLGGTFTLMPTTSTTFHPNFDSWLQLAVFALGIHRNRLPTVVDFSSLSQRPFGVQLHPGPGHASVVRWRAPAAGTYRFDGQFEGIDFLGPTSTLVHIRHNGTTPVLDGAINGFGGIGSRAAFGVSPSVPFSFTRTMGLGETMDFIVREITSDVGHDSTGLQLTVTPTAADLTLTKTAPGAVNLGDQLAYTLTVNNTGALAASGVVLSDPIPPGASLVSAVASQGSCTGTSSVVCNLGAVNAGASATVTLTVLPTRAGSLSNTATVAFSGTDPTPAGNTATATTTVATPSTCGAASSGSVCTTPTGGTAFPKTGAPVIFSFTLRRTLPAGSVSLGRSGGVTALRICRRGAGLTIVVVRGSSTSASAACPP